jgi:hypothetical protein
MKMKLFAKFGFVALAKGAFPGVGLPAKAGQPDWVGTERVQFLKAVGIAPPGLHSHNGNQMPAAKVEQKNAVQASQPASNDVFRGILNS